MQLLVLQRHIEAFLLFFLFSCLYIGLAWLVSGGDRWWVMDHIAGFNIFYGDDAYRFFLARSAWLNADLYGYNFVLPASLFLEGVVTTLSQGDLFISRGIHALLGSTTLLLIWLCGRTLDISRPVMILATLVAGLMPFFALVSLSFYGEVWLGLMISFSLFLFIRNYWLLLACVVGLLPLIRPEGLFFMIPFWFYLLKERKWLCCIMMLVPGVAYGIFLLLWLPTLSDMGLWRIELRKILAKVPLSENHWREMKLTYSPFFTVPAIIGLLFKSLWRIWPWLTGAIIWALFLILTVSMGLSDYEPRYTYSLIPALVILWASFWMCLVGWIRQRKSLPISAAAFLFMVFCLSGHFLKVMPISRYIEKNGVAGLVHVLVSAKWTEVFGYHSKETIESWAAISGQIEELLISDDGIDKLIMFEAPLYYHVNPRLIPDHVVVGFPAMGYLAFQVLLDGQIFAQHPGGRMYSYLRFGVPSFSGAERRALYADVMPMPNYPYRWKKGDIQLYLFSYQESSEPEVNLEQAELVTKERLLKEFLRWRL